ncbi:MAG: CHAT domain-containing protein [Pyrinomonadaceae bacterium]|nr:CHAT domain-containing protein [Pyrinomonadaceae bacterium]
MRSAIPTARFPQADEEVAAINRIFQRADIYTGKDATVARVSDTQTRTAFVHFATHGMKQPRPERELPAARRKTRPLDGQRPCRRRLPIIVRRHTTRYALGV